MWHWNVEGNFNPDLLVRRSNWSQSYSLQSLWPDDPSIAFSVPPLLPPDLVLVEARRVEQKAEESTGNKVITLKFL
jgi:hypothetical protein